MKVGAKSSKWGYGFLILAALLFCFYFWLMLEPVQSAAIAKGNPPSWVLYAFIGVFFGGLFGSLTMIGFVLTKPKWFGIEYEVRFGDIVNSASVRLWVIISMGLFAFITALMPSNV
jgi:hypothetical protein